MSEKCVKGLKIFWLVSITFFSSLDRRPKVAGKKRQKKKKERWRVESLR
jgi:hypothetical protein